MDLSGIKARGAKALLSQGTLINVIRVVLPSNKKLFNRAQRRGAIAMLRRHQRQVDAYGHEGRYVRLKRGLLVPAQGGG